jgi:hypothetical protein
MARKRKRGLGSYHTTRFESEVGEALHDVKEGRCAAALSSFRRATAFLTRNDQVRTLSDVEGQLRRHCLCTKGRR